MLGGLTRLWHLAAAVVTLLVVSFAWIVAVDLIPASQRPYVSDSGTNSELSLALGYNGFGRLAMGLFSPLTSIPLLHVRIDFTIVPAIAAEIGSPSVFRLIQPQIGGQASWLLPLAIAGLIAAAVRVRPRLPLAREHAAVLLWGGWLLTAGGFFSVARFYHLYYLNVLAPPISALAGIGLVALWRDYRESLLPPDRSLTLEQAGESLSRGPGGQPVGRLALHDSFIQSTAAARRQWWKGWPLPGALLATALIQANILGGYAGWHDWLGPAVVIATLVVAIALIAGRLRVQVAFTPDHLFRFDLRTTLAVTTLGGASLLAAPTAFAAASITGGNGGAWLPQAGPSAVSGFGGFRGLGGPPGGRTFRFTSGFPGFSPGAGALPGGSAPGRGFAGRFGPGGPGGGAGAMTFAGNQVPTLDAKLLRYLETHRGNAKYLVATMTSSYASLFILDTGQPVMALGGYQGWDKILTASRLSRMVSSGQVRFFLISGAGDTTGVFSGSRRASGQFGFPGTAAGPFGNAGLQNNVDVGLNTINNDLVRWITSHCTAVASKLYQTASSRSSVFGRGGPGGSGGAGRLYDCAAASSK